MKKVLAVLATLLTCICMVKAQAWQPCNLAPNGNDTWGTSLCVHNNKIFACNNINGLQVSTDDGATWAVANSNIGSTGVDLYSTGDRLYAQLTSSGCMQLLYSTNDGVSFSWDTLALPTCYANTPLRPSSASSGATVAWKNHLMMSLAGPDWEWTRNTADSAWIDASYFDANDCSEFVVKNDTCWAATNGATSNGVAWSADGLNWTSPTTVGLPPYYVPTTLAWNGNRLFMMGGDVGAGNAGADTILKYSDDYGITFTEVNITQYLDPFAFFTYTGKQPTYDMFTGYGKLYLALGQDALESAPELIVSHDNGLTFQKDTAGFPTAVVGSLFTITDMVFHNGWAFAQVNSGDVFRKQIGPTSIGTHVPAQSPYSIYPNPAQSVLHIVPVLNIAAITLADVGGRMLVQSTNDKLDITSLNAGIYVLNIKTKDNKFYVHKLTIN